MDFFYSPDGFLSSRAGVGASLQRHIEAYSHALNINPHSPQGHNKIGNLYRLIGNFGKAIEHLKRAIELKPSKQDAVSNLQALEKQVQAIQSKQMASTDTIVAKTAVQPKSKSPADKNRPKSVAKKSPSKKPLPKSSQKSGHGGTRAKKKSKKK